MIDDVRSYEVLGTAPYARSTDDAFTVLHVCGNDAPRHAMTQYVLQLSKALRARGMESLFLSDMDVSAVPVDHVQWVVPGVRREQLTMALLRTFATDRPFVLHSHLSHPNHGTLDPALLASVPSVITCHEHSNKSALEQAAQLEMCASAAKVMVSSPREAAVLARDPRVAQRLAIHGVEGERQLIYPVPANIEPPSDMELSAARAPGVVWFGMIRTGPDWGLLAKIAEELDQRVPGVPFHLVGAAVNPRALISLLMSCTHIPHEELDVLAKAASRRDPALDREVLAALRPLAAVQWNRSRRARNLELHLDLPPEAVSELLARSATCGITLNTPGNWWHSGSLAALLAHGLPVVAALPEGPRGADSLLLKGAVLQARASTKDERARLAAEVVTRIVTDRQAWQQVHEQALAHMRRRSQRTVADVCALAYRASLRIRGVTRADGAAQASGSQRPPSP